MTKTTAPAIKDSSEDYTKITFSPDLAKFKMESLDKDTVDLLSRRAYDVAASTRGVKVYLNDQRLPVRTNLSCFSFTLYACQYKFMLYFNISFLSVYYFTDKKFQRLH